uniref:Uncharacterized protein n=1 Tax=Alexandrium catenella TaxID=2925 RepID=A0A7S1QWC1_ALECA|mmetsp:Transcript_40280/g.108850  ORF Transcript_40280/g.108850 Transcript_40280/m.108850 type:complete len:350 (+) Transcript_40280:58-1107(+)
MGAGLGDLGFADGKKIVSVVSSVESPGWQGKLSVVSEPLDEHADFYKLWMGMIKWMKNGRKWSKLEMELPRFFLVAQLAPRSLFPATPASVPRHELSPQSQDCVAIARMHHLDRQQRNIRVEASTNGHIVEREYYVFHEAPLCVEAWRETPGTRFAGEWLRAVTMATLEIILTRAHPGERDPCWIYPNVEDPPNSGLMSVISDPLDKLIDFERIWIEWLDLLKYPNSKGGPVKDVKLRIMSEMEFTVLQLVDGAQAEKLHISENKPGTVVRDFKKVHYHKEARAIYVEHLLEGAETPKRYWIRFWDKPLRVQSWGETPGKRDAGEEFGAHLERVVNSALTGQEDLKGAS